MVERETFVQLFHEDGNTVSVISGRTVEQVPLLRRTVEYARRMILRDEPVARIDPLGRICVERSQAEFNQLIKCLRDGTWHVSCDQATGLPVYGGVTQVVDAFTYYGLDVPPFCMHCCSFVTSSRRMCLKHTEPFNANQGIYSCCGQPRVARGCRLSPHELTTDLSKVTFSSGATLVCPPTAVDDKGGCWTVNPHEGRLLCLAPRAVEPVIQQPSSEQHEQPVIIQASPDPILPPRPFGVGYRPRNSVTPTDKEASPVSTNEKKSTTRASKRKTKLCPAHKAGNCSK